MPFVVVIRLPFALAWILFDKLSNLFSWLSDKSYDIMTMLPEVRYSDEWVKVMDERNIKRRREVLDELQRASQKG
jgi:hypothetical protein